MIEVELTNKKSFVQETLTRMGIANKQSKIIYPSCYLYENDGKFYIAHFKELFSLVKDQSYDNFSQEDIYRRNSIVESLKNWDLIIPKENYILSNDTRFYVIAHRDKKNWKIIHKFNINSLNNT